jgi:hypothetical protein
MYQRADNEGKKAIIGSMYPEKLHFNGQQHRTNRVNEIIALIHLISNILGSKKEGQELINILVHLGAASSARTIDEICILSIFGIKV